ncbi:hypothetical protein [Dissulfuribacter thermophilus]|nr:hypothetical protein [Dissulfuribacter thermophilus]
MLVVLLSGCAFRSQHVLRQTSLGFNKALQHTLGEQMLLNLVRLRYGESPVFLEVTSISSQYSYSGTISGKADIKEVSPDSYGVNLGFTFAEKPTFTLIPLQGEKFARRLLSPIPIDHLILLLNSGWRVDRVLRLCVQSLNGIPNAPTASGPTPEEAPQFEEFLELVYKLEALRKNGKLRFAYVKKENQAIPALILSGQGSLEKEVREMLGLIDAPYYPLVGLEAPKGPSVIQLETRSLIGVLFYLSHGIEIPVKDLENGKAIITRDQDGRYFSWQRLLGDLFNIHQNEQLPSEANIAVKYRGRWYYISDQDTSTKSTFILLQQLFALEASKGKGMSPLLTLPVN